VAVAKSVIEFALTADASGLVGGIQKAKGEFASMEQAAGKAGQTTGQSLEAMQTRMSSVGNKMLGVGAAMTAATLPLTLALKSGLEGLKNAEVRAAQTAAVLKSTGGAANVTAEGVTTLANSLRDMSGVSGGTIREGENMLLTFTRIRNGVGEGNDIFDQATKSVLNMSVAMGTDMKTASIQVGKALNDPVNGLTALNRVGIQFTETQKEQIKGFIAVGDVASAQKVILAELEKQFGGSAEAFGNTAAGQAAKLENEFMKLKMTLAQELMPAFKTVIEVVRDGVNWFNSLDEGSKKWIATVAVALVAGGPILTGLGAVTKLVSGLIGVYGKLTVAATEAAAAETAAANAGTGAILTKTSALKQLLATISKGALAGGAGGLLGGGGDPGAGATGAIVGAGAGLIGSGALAGPLGVLAGATSTTNPISVRDTSDEENGFIQLQHVVENARNSIAQAGDDMEAKFASIRNSVGSNMIGSAEDIQRLQGELQRLAQENGIASLSFDGTSTSITGMTGHFYTAEQVTSSVASSLGRVAEVAANVGPAQQQAAAQQQVAQAAQAAGINIQALQTNLETMFQPYLSAEQSALAYEQSLQGLDATMQQRGATDLQVQQGMFGLLSATGAQINALAESVASESEYQVVQERTKAKLDELAQKYPQLRDKADEYKTKIDELIAQSKNPITNKVNVETDEATRKLNDYKRLAASIQDNILTQHVPVPAAPEGARGGIIQGDVAYFARGGLFNRATAIVGEGNAPEYVIPTDRKYRGRALGLWQQAGAALMAEGGVVGGDGAAAPASFAVVGPALSPEVVPLLGQIRDILAQMASTGAAATSAPVAAATGAPAAAPGGLADPAAASGGMTALVDTTTAYGVAAAAATVAVQVLDAAVLQSASATLPAATAATQADDLATQSLTLAAQAQVPAQAAWQAQLTLTRAALDLVTAGVVQVIGQMQTLNATQVALHVDTSQVTAAAGSIGSLASAVQGALGSLGLSTNALSQWLGVVLALPSGVLAGAVGAESGGVVGRGNVGAGFTANRPTLVGEGNPAWREYVVPTDPAHRSNAMGLLGALHQDLGVAPIGMEAGGVVGKVGAAIAATTANAARSAWGGTAGSAPGQLGKVTGGSMVAAAAFNVGGGGSQKFVDFAMQQDGEQYVWGAEGPDAWDCSGLVLGAAAAAGLPGLPHYSGSQIDMASPIPVAQGISTAGAILWRPGHIAISQGNGRTIEARGVAYGVGQWDAGGRFERAGLLPFPGASGSVSDSLSSGWQSVGKYIADKFREAGVGVGPSVGGEAGEASGESFTGRISTFGGPNDPGARGGMAYNGTTVDAYYAGVPYAAMRLSAGTFQGRRGEIPFEPRSWIQIDRGGATTRAQILDWGPGWRTNRLVDVAPYVADAIGANTDDTVTVTGVQSYDSGGFLPPGLSLAYNGTGVPEPVVPAGRVPYKMAPGTKFPWPVKKNSLPKVSATTTVAAGAPLPKFPPLAGSNGAAVVVNVYITGSVTAEEDLVTTITDAINANTRRGYVGVG